MNRDHHYCDIDGQTSEIL